MSDTTAQEPTMEEILASIRRIISEDDAPAANEDDAAPAATEAAPAEPSPEPAFGDEQDDDDVLELTDPLGGQTEPDPQPQPVEASFHETLGDLDVSPRAAPESAPHAAAPAPAASSTPERPLLDSLAANAAASHFERLSRTLSMPADTRTIEDVVKDLLQPLLKDWLDRNLPSIVEAKVQAEVERVSRSKSY